MSETTDDTEGQAFKMKQGDAGAEDTEGQGFRKFHVENEGVDGDTEGNSFRGHVADAGEEDDAEGNAHRI